MEMKEWRRLAAQSVSLLLVVFICCICFSQRLQQSAQTEAHAEAKLSKGMEEAKKQDEENVQEMEKTIQWEEAKKEVKGVVVLDAGHGGMDEGTSSKNGKYLEKDYTLLIVNRVKELLEESNIKVYYTRTDDRNVSKKKRTDLADRKKADLFISIHCNASSDGDTTANGLAALYSMRTPKTGSIKNKELAKVMLEELSQATGLRKRGVIRREQLYLLHHAKVPTTIVEIGYMSNKDDLNFMKKEEGQKKIAQGICDGIARALEEK